MTETVELLGMTWDHARGYDPMVATSGAFQKLHPYVNIKWEKRSLQAFADRPIHEMAGRYDLMVIDHPHVGEVAERGDLLALDGIGRDAALDDMAKHSIGASHASYQFNDRQWALAIDAATPVAAYRADKIGEVPKTWDEMMVLARKGHVAFALIPINALMTFMGLCQNMDLEIATDERFVSEADGTRVLEMLREVLALMDPRVLELDPIGIYDRMGNEVDAPAYSPFGYGYTNYSRDGYCTFPLTFADAPGVKKPDPKGTVLGGTGIAVSSHSGYQEIAVEYAFWIASAECQAGVFFDAGGQPAHAAAWDSDHCNAKTRDFFKNTRKTLDRSWVRPRFDGYMGFQDAAGTLIHQFLKGEAALSPTLNALENAYQEART